jgi:hypothetical protein
MIGVRPWDGSFWNPFTAEEEQPHVELLGSIVCKLKCSVDTSRRQPEGVSKISLALKFPSTDMSDMSSISLSSVEPLSRENTFQRASDGILLIEQFLVGSAQKIVSPLGVSIRRSFIGESSWVSTRSCTRGRILMGDMSSLPSTALSLEGMGVFFKYRSISASSPPIPVDPVDNGSSLEETRATGVDGGGSWGLGSGCSSCETGRSCEKGPLLDRRGGVFNATEFNSGT